MEFVAACKTAGYQICKNLFVIPFRHVPKMKTSGKDIHVYDPSRLQIQRASHDP